MRPDRDGAPARPFAGSWLYSFLLCLPALIFLGVFFFESQIDFVPTVLIGACLLIYLAICASALVDGVSRPLQTLSNVVSSLREGDYSFRARGAAIERCVGRTCHGDQRAGRSIAKAARALA